MVRLSFLLDYVSAFLAEWIIFNVNIAKVLLEWILRRLRLELLRDRKKPKKISTIMNSRRSSMRFIDFVRALGKMAFWISFYSDSHYLMWLFFFFRSVFSANFLLIFFSLNFCSQFIVRRHKIVINHSCGYKKVDGMG